jgi:tartrate dehydratase alpha subunit/fumarate hydratase class I-like protein
MRNRYVSSDEADILCQDYGQCVHFGEVSAAEQPLGDQLAEIIKQLRRRQTPKPTNLIDRVVHGIRNNVNNANSGNLPSSATNPTTAPSEVCNPPTNIPNTSQSNNVAQPTLSSNCNS